MIRAGERCPPSPQGGSIDGGGGGVNGLMTGSHSLLSPPLVPPLGGTAGGRKSAPSEAPRSAAKRPVAKRRGSGGAAPPSGWLGFPPGLGARSCAGPGVDRGHRGEADRGAGDSRQFAWPERGIRLLDGLSPGVGAERLKGVPMVTSDAHEGLKDVKQVDSMPSGRHRSCPIGSADDRLLEPTRPLARPANGCPRPPAPGPPSRRPVGPP